MQRRHTVRGVGLLVTTLTTALVLTSCSEPEAPEDDAPGGDAGSEQDAADGAEASSGEAGEASGPITLYTSEPQEKIDEVIAAFNEEHPDITVEVFRAGTGDLNARIASELETGEVAADVLLAADAPTFEGYKEQDLLAEYTPADADAPGPDSNGRGWSASSSSPGSSSPSTSSAPASSLQCATILLQPD